MPPPGHLASESILIPFLPCDSVYCVYGCVCDNMCVIMFCVCDNMCVIMFIIVGKKICVCVDWSYCIHLSVMNCCCSWSFGEKRESQHFSSIIIILILVQCLVAIVLTQSYSTWVESNTFALFCDMSPWCSWSSMFARFGNSYSLHLSPGWASYRAS